MDYHVYNSIDEVPREYLVDDLFVIEKFLPEREGEFYYSNLYVFMGESYHCFRLGSPDKIVNSQSNSSREIIEPHPEVVARRRQLKFDYGKFDYCMHNGKPVLLDINKLIGMSNWKYRKEINEMVRARGEGIYGFFEE
jgi:hypothetical protein